MNRSVLRILAASVLLLSACGDGSRIPPPAAAREEPELPDVEPVDIHLAAERVHRITLPNGMRFLLMERRDAPVIAAMVRVGAGGGNEVPGITGSAHLLEHLLFKGTERIGTTHAAAEEEINRRIESLVTAIESAAGSDGGADPAAIEELRSQLKDARRRRRELLVKEEFSRLYARHGFVGINATTSQDWTAYYCNFPANRLELWAFLEADRLGNAVLREFYQEREVVQEERRRGYESRPGGMLWETLLSTAYRSHPYGLPVIGWPADLQRIRREDVRAFYRKHYVPSNMVGALVGDFSTAEVEPILQKYFGELRGGERPLRPRTAEPVQYGERRAEVLFDATPRMSIAWHIPGIGHPDRAALEILAGILAEGRTSRLERNLVEEGRLAAEVSAEALRRVDPALFVVGGTVASEGTLDALESALLAEIDALRTHPPAAWEVRRVQNRFQSDRIARYESALRTASDLSYQELFGGDWSRLNVEARALMAVTPEAVRDVAARYLVASNRSVIRLRPPAPREETLRPPPAGNPLGRLHTESAPAGESEARSPGAAIYEQFVYPELKWTLPERGVDVTRHELGNDLVVYTVPDPSLPVMRGRIWIEGGDATDPPGQEGTAALGMRVLREGGSERFPGGRIDEILDFLGGSLEMSSDTESLGIDLRILQREEDRELVLDILASLLREPAFPKEVLRREREELADAIRRTAEDPAALLRREFPRLIYGDHPYGRRADPASVASIDRDDLLAWHRRTFRPDRIVMAFSGDIDTERLRADLEERLGDWGSADGPAPTVPPVAADPRSGIFFRRNAEATQAQVRVGHLGVGRNTPDRFAAQLLNAVLGEGTFTSRLGQRIRSDEGLAYSVGSRFEDDTSVRGLFYAAAGTRNDRVARTIEVIREEIERIRQGPVTAAELTQAREILRNGLTTRLADPAARARTLAEQEFRGLPDNELAARLEAYRMLTAEDLLRVAREYLRPDRLTILVVGGDEALAALREAFGEESVTVLE